MIRPGTRRRHAAFTLDEIGAFAERLRDVEPGALVKTSRRDACRAVRTEGRGTITAHAPTGSFATRSAGRLQSCIQRSRWPSLQQTRVPRPSLRSLGAARATAREASDRDDGARGAGVPRFQRRAAAGDRERLCPGASAHLDVRERRADALRRRRRGRTPDLRTVAGPPARSMATRGRDARGARRARRRRGPARRRLYVRRLPRGRRDGGRDVAAAADRARRGQRGAAITYVRDDNVPLSEAALVSDSSSTTSA